MLPDARLDAAIAYIETSRADLADGKIIVLEGFQHEVENIHHIIANLPKDEAQIYKPKIEILLNGLKILEGELKAEQHKVQQEIFSLNRRQQALKSYETSNHSGGDDGQQ